MRDSYIDQIYANIILEQLEKVQILTSRAHRPQQSASVESQTAGASGGSGFLSNASDLAKLTDPQFRQVLAEAIGQGMIEFLNFYRLEQS